MAFINGIGIISPQNTLPGSDFLMPAVEHTADFLKSIEPVFKSYIDPIASRRLSRLIKMGISSAKMCMQDAGYGMQDAGCRMQDAGCGISCILHLRSLSVLPVSDPRISSPKGYEAFHRENGLL